MKINHINFYVENLIGFQTLESPILYILKKGFTVKIYHILKENELLFIKKKIKNKNIQFEKIQLNTYSRILNNLNFALTVLFTKNNFPKPYRSFVKHHSQRNLFGVITFFLSNVWLKISFTKVNYLVHKIISVLNKNQSIDKIIVHSRISNVSFLNKKRLKIITIIESWDHIYKKPMGYLDKLTYLWNHEQIRDFKKFQSLSNCKLSFPKKISYLINSEKFMNKDNKIKTILYPASTSSFAERENLFKSELEFIEYLCSVISKTKYKLIIKTKPNGKKGDFDSLRVKYSNIKILDSSIFNSTSNFYIDDEEIKKRRDILDKVDAVLNIATTYAIDACLYNKPVIQLDFDKSNKFLKLKEFQKNYHLQKFLLKNNYTYKIDEFISSLKKNQISLFNAYQFGISLKKKFYPKIGEVEFHKDLLKSYKTI